MEKEILAKNKYLKEYLSYERLYEQPLVISQISFERKKPIEDGVFMVGDAAGLIVPLCGNGMSMALKAAHEFHKLSERFYLQQISRKQLTNQYLIFWNKEFSARLTAGRTLQKLFYNKYLVNPTLQLLNKTSWLTASIVRLTHGKDII